MVTPPSTLYATWAGEYPCYMSVTAAQAKRPSLPAASPFLSSLARARRRSRSDLSNPCLAPPQGRPLPRYASLPLQATLMLFACGIAIAVLPEPLFPSEFSTPTGHAPYARFQERPLQPHHGEPIVAEEHDITRHFADAKLKTVPAVDPGSGESPDLVHAAQWVSSNLLQHVNINELRYKLVEEFAAAMVSYKQQSQLLLQSAPPTVKAISAKYNVAGIDAIVRQLGFPDTSFAPSLITGFKLVGVLMPTFVHRKKFKAATYDHAQCHHSDNKRLVGSIRRRALKSSAAQLADIAECYSKSMQEVEDGWAEGPFTFDDMCERFPQGWWAMRRNPHRRYPGAPVRPVDDARRSRHNDATESHESISCENADFGCRMAALFYSLMGPVAMKQGTDDLKKAFRQIPCSQPQYNVVAQWSPADDAVRFFVLRGMPFGCTSSVLHFNRLPTFMVTVLRCYFGVCVTNFYDDYCVAEPAATVHSAQWCVRRLHEIFGFLLDPDKHVRAATQNAFLGVVTDFTRVLRGYVVFRIKEERRLKLVAALQHVLEVKRLTPTESSSMRGKLYFTAGTCFGRVGVPMLQAFTSRQYGKGTHITAALAASIAFFLALLRAPLPKVTEIWPRARKALLVWSDAMLENGVGKIGFVIYDPEDAALIYSAYEAPAWLLRSFAHPLHCIGQLEIMAALMVYLLLDSDAVIRARVAGRDVLHWVDNTSAIFALFKGYSPSADSCKLIVMFHALMAKLQFRVWWEYVASKANIADLPSRWDFALLRRWKATWVDPVWMSPAKYDSPLEDWLPDASGGTSRSPRASGAAKRKARALSR
jgi:hypothetical protein